MKTDLCIKRISRFMVGRRSTAWVDKICFEPFEWKIYKNNFYRIENLILLFKLDPVADDGYKHLSNICDKLTLYIEKENE